VSLDQQHLQERLTALARKSGVVGASLAVQLGESQAVAATGVLNLRTQQPATPESVFQFGSITKVWTATLVMQLVDEGLLDLDEPLVRYLPDFSVAAPALTAAVTARHLLDHTSGIDGDYFPDTGRGDDCLARYVEGMSGLGQTHPLGATMSYCNTGFVVLGRLVEVLRGTTWDAALRTHLLAPLGLEAAGTLPEEALLWGAATGHLVPPGTDGPVVAPQWGLPRAAGPAGLLHGRATDLLAFARLHLFDGPSGLLSPASTEAMRVPHVEVPDRWTFGGSIGLGWMLYDWGRPVFGHDGSTLGQNAFLRVLPEHEGQPALVVGLCTNGGETRDLYHDVVDEIVSTYAGAVMPARIEPPSSPLPFDAGRYVGRYARESMSHEVVERDGELVMVTRPTGVLATAVGADQFEEPLRAFAPDAFLTRLPTVAGWLPVAFYDLPDGSRYLHLAGRATPRTG
jgi:CubicO group peptidase (beta-lactamase class C family)